MKFELVNILFRIDGHQIDAVSLFVKTLQMKINRMNQNESLSEWFYLSACAALKDNCKKMSLAVSYVCSCCQKWWTIVMIWNWHLSNWVVVVEYFFLDQAWVNFGVWVLFDEWRPRWWREKRAMISLIILMIVVYVSTWFIQRKCQLKSMNKWMNREYLDS